MSLATAATRLRQLSMCSLVVWKLPTAMRIKQRPWNSLGVVKPSSMFLTRLASSRVRRLEGAPLLSFSWKSTVANCTACTSKSDSKLSIILTACFPFFSWEVTAVLSLSRPQWTKVQQSLSALFLRVWPTTQSLQSMTPSLSMELFLQMEKESALAPKDSLRSFLSPTKKREPPVPLSSSIVKLTSRESTCSSSLLVGRFLLQIQVLPRKAASRFTHSPCALQQEIIRSSTSIAPLKVFPQLSPIQNGIRPFWTSYSTVLTKKSKSSSQFSLSVLYLQGMERRQGVSLISSALSELRWLPSPKYPTNFRMSGLRLVRPSSFIFLNLAAWTLTNMDSEVEPLIVPPPLFFIINFEGKPRALADQSSTTFSSSVYEGATVKLKLGVWKVVVNISAMTEVTLME